MSQTISAESNGKEVTEGITGISVQGYKSLYEECSIEIRPLTILAGANSSGKSSIMQPLLLMKQTLEATYDPGALLLNGPNVRFTFAEQFLSNLSTNREVTNFAVQIESNERKIRNVFSKLPGRPIDISETVYQESELQFTISPSMNQEEILAFYKNLLRIKRHRDGKDRNWINNLFQELFQEDELNIDYLQSVIARNRCFINFSFKYSLDSGIINVCDTRTFTASFESYIQKLIHIPGIRGNPERTYKTTAAIGRFPGNFENYIASVINQWKNTQDNRFRQLEVYLNILGLTGKVDVKNINDVQLELRVGRLPRNGETIDMVSVADVGIGVSQVLPVLVALLVAEPGQLVYLEQPEIHLHPRAQAALAEILADAAKRGVRVVLETHSELLLLGVQSLVAEGKLSPELVKLHWFTRREDGVTVVSSAELDESGAFGDWPEDFSDVSLKLESRYLDAAEAHLWNR
jgi:predicted ATPase